MHFRQSRKLRGKLPQNKFVLLMRGYLLCVPIKLLLCKANWIRKNGLFVSLETILDETLLLFCKCIHLQLTIYLKSIDLNMKAERIFFIISYICFFSEHRLLYTQLK